MEPLRRVTESTVDVLRLLLDSSEPTWGLRLIKASERPAGTVYPILERLERQGWITSEWESDSERAGPRRRLYSLTVEGAAAARTVCATYDARVKHRNATTTGKLATS